MPENEAHFHRWPAFAVLSLTSHCMTSWWRWDLWRQMNFSLRDDKVVNRIENEANGLEKKGAFVLRLRSRNQTGGVWLGKVKRRSARQGETDLHSDAFHEWLAITLTSVKYFIQAGIRQSSEDRAIMKRHKQTRSCIQEPHQLVPPPTFAPPKHTYQRPWSASSASLPFFF